MLPVWVRCPSKAAHVRPERSRESSNRAAVPPLSSSAALGWYLHAIGLHKGLVLRTFPTYPLEPKSRPERASDDPARPDTNRSTLLLDLATLAP